MRCTSEKSRQADISTAVEVRPGSNARDNFMKLNGYPNRAEYGGNVYGLPWEMSTGYETVRFAAVARLAALKLGQQHLHEGSLAC